jgi:hypothetical protein
VRRSIRSASMTITATLMMSLSWFLLAAARVPAPIPSSGLMVGYLAFRMTAGMPLDSQSRTAAVSVRHSLSLLILRFRSSKCLPVLVIVGSARLEQTLQRRTPGPAPS